MTMFIRELFRKARPVISFEVFPPKADAPVESVYRTIEALKDLAPDYISVTYGAGGTSRDRTVEIASRIRNHFGIEALAHLTCRSHTPGEIDDICEELLDEGVQNILALRGDPQPGEEENPNASFSYACDLVKHLRENHFGNFCIGAAAYPEGHVECPDPMKDLDFLKAKVDAGVDFLVTQLFFDNELFYRFRDAAEKRGIHVPLVAGVFPVLNARQVQRIVSLCGASLPPRFTRIMARYANSPEALEEAGVAYATDQVIDLLASGVEGIHLYTMNRPGTTRRIMENIALIRKTASPEGRMNG
jgi:methylenetetrahydrofolate reductase (NADPH)